jgi:hypothetical protein
MKGATPSSGPPGPPPPQGPHPFRLRPFASDPGLEAFELTGWARRGVGGDRLELRYELRGPLEQLRIPEPVESPERRDGLWEATCFEAFLAVEAEEAYREINLSPAGHWNLYRLDGYRRGLRPEPALTALPLTQLRTAESLWMGLTLDLSALLPAPQPLELAITAVLEGRDGALSHWALAHPGGEADFHRRDGFLLCL